MWTTKHANKQFGVIRVGILSLALITVFAFGGLWSPEAKRSVPVAKPLPSDEAATTDAIRFLAARVRRDPDDFVAQNQLAGHFLHRLRETNNADFLRFAKRAAEASLTAVPVERNTGGLAALAHAEFAAHEFARTRDHALQLIQLDPGKSESYALLGDALSLS